MGRAPCKIIIDQMHALIRALWCMATSLLVFGGEPSPAHQKAFQIQAEEMAKLCGEIEKDAQG